MLKHLQRFLARKMGVADDRPIPDALAFLADGTKLEDSWNRYFSTSAFYRDHVKQWRAANPGKAEDEKPSPSIAFRDLAGSVLLTRFELFGPADETIGLKVQLACPVKPYATNGKWGDAASTLTWSEDLQADRILPLECFAFWSEPNEAFQTQHFGRVLLRDEALARYCLEYCGLSPDEARQWDALLSECDPKQAFQEPIAAFRFAGEPQPSADNKPSSRADRLRSLLLEEQPKK